MKTLIYVAAALTLIAPTSSFAATKHTKAAPIIYVCQKCHMQYSAADAKKDHYKDPMDGGALIPQKTMSSTKTSKMGGMTM